MVTTSASLATMNLGQMLGGQRPKLSNHALGPPKRDWAKAGYLKKAMYSFELAYYHSALFISNTTEKVYVATQPILAVGWMVGVSVIVFAYPLYYLSSCEIEVLASTFSRKSQIGLLDVRAMESLKSDMQNVESKRKTRVVQPTFDEERYKSRGSSLKAEGTEEASVDGPLGMRAQVEKKQREIDRAHSVDVIAKMSKKEQDLMDKHGKRTS